MTRTGQVRESVWADAVVAAREGLDGGGLAVELARHAQAPVRATVSAFVGDVATRCRLTVAGGQVLLVTQAVQRSGDGSPSPGRDRRVTVTDVEGLWPALQDAIPAIDVLRAPANVLAGSRRGDVVARGEQAVELVAGATARLDVSVEAWRDGAVAAVWVRSWVVVDGRLLDARTADGELVVRERAAGAVASELEWALGSAAVEVAR